MIVMLFVVPQILRPELPETMAGLKVLATYRKGNHSDWQNSETDSEPT